MALALPRNSQLQLLNLLKPRLLLLLVKFKPRVRDVFRVCPDGSIDGLFLDFTNCVQGATDVQACNWYLEQLKAVGPPFYVHYSPFPFLTSSYTVPSGSSPLLSRYLGHRYLGHVSLFIVKRKYIVAHTHVITVLFLYVV